jgi:hypothetical protein
MSNFPACPVIFATEFAHFRAARRFCCHNFPHFQKCPWHCAYAVSPPLAAAAPAIGEQAARAGDLPAPCIYS